MNTVRPAEPYRGMAMGSFGDASGMYLRQFNFPNTYRDDEEIWSSDHDRIQSWDFTHWIDTVRKYEEKIGNGGWESWFKNGDPQDLLAFLIEAMKAEGEYKWTGFRILGTVNRSNGYPVYTFQLFAKKDGSGTKVYSNQNAPNVKRRPVRHSYRTSIYF